MHFKQTTVSCIDLKKSQGYEWITSQREPQAGHIFTNQTT